MKTFLIKKLFAVLSSVIFAHGGDNFYVEKSGNSQVKPGEISVIFYMTVANGGKQTIKVNSKNTRCCWIHPGSSSDYDCESMDLLGGIPLTLEPTKKGNITYIFTNLYPMDRVGQCVFHLWHEDIKIAHTIRFNTTLPKETSWLRSLYESITGDFKENKACDTMDLDPRRKCKPVKCVQKYNGKRNYFRKETKRCEPVHECITTTDEDNLPTSAFDKDHNSCKSLIQNQLSKEDERNMKKDMEKNIEKSQRKKFKNINPNDPIPVRCNHGKRVGAICVCEDGWKTDTSKVPLGDPKFVYDWCNVKTRKKPLLSFKHQKNFMIAGLSFTSFTLLVAWSWMMYRYFYRNDIFQAQRHGQTLKSPLRSKGNIEATIALIKELADKTILKRKSETPTKPLYSTTGVNSEKPSASKHETISAPSPESSISMQSRAVQKGKSTLTPSKQSIRSHSTRSLAGEESGISFTEASKVSHKGTKSFPRPSLKSPSTDSRTEKTDYFSFPRNSTNENRGSAAPSFVSQTASKDRSTYSLAGEAALYGPPARSDRGQLVSVSQISRGQSTFSPASEADNVSTIDTRGTMLSGSKTYEDGSVYSLAGNASNVPFHKDSFTRGTVSTPSRLNQIPKDHSLYTLVSEAGIASVTSKAVKTEMLSRVQSPNARSFSHFSGESSNISFAGELMKSDRSIPLSENKSSKSPALYSLSGHKSTNATKISLGDTSVKESVKSGVSGKSMIKDNSSSTKIAAGHSQKSMVIALHNSSSDSD